MDHKLSLILLLSLMLSTNLSAKVPTDTTIVSGGVPNYRGGFPRRLPRQPQICKYDPTTSQIVFSLNGTSPIEFVIYTPNSIVHQSGLTYPETPTPIIPLYQGVYRIRFEQDGIEFEEDITGNI